MYTGGVEILIREQIDHHITHIHQINRRLPNVTLQSKNSHKPLTILNTYAPHKGYAKLEQKEHWGKANQSIENTKSKYVNMARRHRWGNWENKNRGGIAAGNNWPIHNSERS